MIPYYEEAGITIYHGDCRDVLPSLDPVDLVLTDPPYGVNKRQRTYAVASGPVAVWDEAFPLWWIEPVAKMSQVLAFTPGIVNLPACPSHVDEQRYRWTLAAHVANGMTRGPFGYGNWIPCVVYARDGVRLYQQRNDVERVSIRGGDRPDHPSPKPLAAIEFFLSRLPGETVLDAFMGSGTTLLAAKNLGRKAIGIETSEAYCEIAAKRLQKSVMAQAGIPEEEIARMVGEQEKRRQEMSAAFSVAGAGAQEEADQETQPGATQPQPGEAA